MEAGRTSEQDYDEIEMLLGEIPRETSGNPQSRHNFEQSKFSNLYNSPVSGEDFGRMGFYGGSAIDQEHITNGEQNYASNNRYEAPGQRHEQDESESNLPDEKTLALAFEGLSFKDGVVSETPSPYRFNQNSPSMALRSEINGVNHRKLPECNGFEPEKQKREILSCNLADQPRNFPVMPMNPGLHTYQSLPNVALPRTDLTTSLYSQQLYVDVHTPSFMPSCNVGRSDMTWQKLEEEWYYALHRQYLYQQQLQNNGSELLQFGKHVNLGIGPLTGSQRQPFFEIPSNVNSYWNDSALHKMYSQLDLSLMGGNLCQYPQSSDRKAYSANDMLEWQVFDRFRKHYFPEKILTRSHGVNSLRSLRPDPVVNDQLPSFANKNGRALSNGHLSHAPYTSNGTFELDCQDSRCHIPDVSDTKSLDLKFNSIDEVLGSIYYLAKDQLGCRFLQRTFTEGSPEDVGKIFAEITGHVVELMTHPFGNYLVQKLLEVCNEQQRMHILNAITRETGVLIRISCNMHGTRAVQKVIETLQNTQQISMVVSSLKPGIVSLMKDVNGNHVAQRCLQYFSSVFNEFLYDAAIAHCTELAVDRQGCCVLQKCVHHSEGDRKDRLLSEICSNSYFLSQNPFGNYVVQFVLDQKISWATSALLGQLKGKYENLSKQKHGSNVVEKCLKYASEEDRNKIIQELINNPRFLQIVLDQFGNYVVQSALKHCKGALLSALVEAIKPHVPALRTNPYGKKVLSSSVLKKLV